MTIAESGVGRRLVGIAGCALALVGAPFASSWAAEPTLGPLVRITGPSPFEHCTVDDVPGQVGINYPNTEIEPWVEVNPVDRLNLIAVWQQDRWSNGGARGNLAGFSRDGGATWRTVVPPRVTKCSGGPWTRASDPWITISPNGHAYFMHLVFQEDLPTGGFGPNAMVVSKSVNGGATWGHAITLRRDTNPQVLNDKNSITADPSSSSFVYAVWDRLRDFTLPPRAGLAGVAGSAGVEVTAGPGDGVVAARQRAQQLRQLATTGARQPTIVFFEGPVFFARTTNGGQVWEPAKNIYDPGGNSQTIANQIVVPPSGVVIDFFTEIAPNGGIRIGLIRSFNKGVTFSRPRYAAVIATVFGVVTPDAQQLVRDASILFDVAVDSQNGNLYLVWQDVRFHGIDEVAFSMSTDGGNTWSSPVRINKTPSNANQLREQAFLPSIETGAGGKLTVTYYDFRFDSDNGREATDHWAIFCHPRRDNCRRAASWGNELRLTTASFDYLKAPVAVGLFLGDYMGLDGPRGTFHPVFGIATGPDLTGLFTRRIDVPALLATGD